jgi:hypothetical protein
MRVCACEQATYSRGLFHMLCACAFPCRAPWKGNETMASLGWDEMGCDGVVPRNKTVATGFGPRGQGPMNGDCSCCWYPGTFRLWHESAPHTCHVNIAGSRTAAHVAIPAYPAGVCVCVCVCAYTDIDIDNGVPRHRRKAEMGAHERDERIGKRLRPFEALKVLILFARSTPEAWQAVVAPAVSVTGGLTGLVQLQKPIAIAAAATRWPRRGVSIC